MTELQSRAGRTLSGQSPDLGSTPLISRGFCTLATKWVFLEVPASCSQVLCTQQQPWDTFQFFSDHFGSVFFSKEISGAHCRGFFCPFSEVTPREGTPRALLLFSLPLHLLLSSQVPVAAFKNKKCVLILVHLRNNCFYFCGEEKRRKNSLRLNNYLSLQPSTLFMRLFFLKSSFSFSLHPQYLLEGEALNYHCKGYVCLVTKSQL